MDMQELKKKLADSPAVQEALSDSQRSGKATPKSQKAPVISAKTADLIEQAYAAAASGDRLGASALYAQIAQQPDGKILSSKLSTLYQKE